MSGSVFVLDAQGKPLMPTSAAYARKLLQSEKAQLKPHYLFSIIQLSREVTNPVLRPIVLGVAIYLHTARLFLIVDGEPQPRPLFQVFVDLQTALSRRMHRRAAHRARRRSRGRYRPIRRHNVPFKLRRPSLARSQPGSLLRQRRLHRPQGRRPSISAIIRWRAEAIARVVDALRSLLPISHITFLTSPQDYWPRPERLTPAERRQALINAYHVLNEQGAPVATCAYCATTQGTIEVDHVLPKSRGGTDAWENLVLACNDCNIRKGDRTPAEAGMVVRQEPQQPFLPRRAQPYRWQTMQVLQTKLAGANLVTWRVGNGNNEIGNIPPNALLILQAVIAGRRSSIETILAKPIARLHKQMYGARNYPLSTPLRPGFVRVGQAVKRRVKVNEGLALVKNGSRSMPEVILAGNTIPDQTQHLVRIGMLVEGSRSGQKIVGLVTAIHSTGRLTVSVPTQVNTTAVTWNRIVVSSRTHLRVLARAGVIFFAQPPKLTGDDQQEGRLHND